jgi:hypothetical protein
LYGGGVNDSAEGADGVGAVDNLAADGHILHYGSGDHDHVVGGARELLDDEVHHLAEGGVLVLEELRDWMYSVYGFVAACADILPKKRVVASCLPQLSPVKSSNASLVKICRGR